MTIYDMTISTTVWQIEFVRPLWFALLAALPLLLIFWRWSLVQFSTGRKIASLLLRSFLLLLVAAGLAEPKATGPASLPFVAAERDHGPGRGSTPPAIEIVAPDHIRAGEPFSLDVLLRSKRAGAASVELLRDGQPLLKESVQLAEGDNQIGFSTIVLKPSQVVYAGPRERRAGHMAGR